MGDDPLQDLLVHLQLDDGLFPATDSSNVGNNGIVNGAIYVPDNGDGSLSSLQFDGVDDNVDLGTLDLNGSGFTLAAWVRPLSFPGESNDPRIISKSTGAALEEHIFMLGTVRSGGETVLRARLRILGVTHTIIATSGNLVANQWQHTAVTFDGERVRLYLDGIEVGVGVRTGTVDRDPSAPVLVGAQPGGSQYFHGSIDDVRILQRPLTANEISLIVSGNGLPIAVPDIYSAVEDISLNVEAINGLLANDNDPDSQPINALLQSIPENGSVSLNGDGSFVYTPNVNYFGTDSFTYLVTDGIGNSNIASVDIVVNGTNDVPCLLYTSPSPRDGLLSRMPSSA